MGDISAEPSMEDILSSIKRIIAEEGDAAIAARGGRKPARPATTAIRPIPESFGHDEILELSNPVPVTDEQPDMDDAPAKPAPASAPAPSTAEDILSPHAAQASRSPLEALSRMVVRPDVSGSDTLEGMVREMIRPMLRDWLDAKLPGMVEAMVAREIARITGKAR